jgi:hypothetical protein
MMQENKIQKKFLAKDRIMGLTKEYCTQYPNLKPDHVESLITKIVYLITRHFDPYSERWKQLRDAKIMQEAITRDFTVEERGRITESCLILYFLNRGNENAISCCFRDKKLTPENPADYQEFCREVTREQVTIITSYFFNSLSHADKVSLGKIDSYQNIENTQNSSFVSRVGGSKKSVSFVADIVNNEGNPRPKKLTHDSVK